MSECVLCKPRGRNVEVPNGHVCGSCRIELASRVRDIAKLAVDAAAYVEPKSSTGSTTGAYGSRPPLNVAQIDPELAEIELNLGDSSSRVTILAMCEMWERAIREDRRMAQYGPTSAARALKAGGRPDDTRLTLIGSVRFLAAQVPWMAETPTFPIEEFNAHITRATRALKRWDQNHETRSHGLRCPSITVERVCGCFIAWTADATEVDCPRCHRTWSIEWLMLVASDADTWLDAEALAQFLGLHEQTLRRWARHGKVAKRGLLYNVRDVAAMRDKNRKEASA